MVPSVGDHDTRLMTAAVSEDHQIGDPRREPSPLLWWIGAIGLLAVISVVQPLWPATVLSILGRVGGIWRSLVLPVPMVGALFLVVVNARTPGQVWSWCLRLPDRSWRTVAKAVLGLTVTSSLMLAVGSVTVAQITRPITMWVLQLALHPDTPMAAVWFAFLIAVIIADRRQVRVFTWALNRWDTRSRGFERGLVNQLPLVATMVLGGVVSGIFFPDAMQGWFREDPPDAQKYNLYSSFFNYSISTTKIVTFDGYELGERGLMLAPGRTGDLTFALERPSSSIVLLKANFYNQRFLQKGEVPGSIPETRFTNALEVSTDRGGTFAPVFVDQSIGDVVGSAPVDLTPAVGRASAYLLKFRATNTASDPVLVLPSMVVSVVVDPLTAPHPAFPVVPFGAMITAALYVGARSVASRPSAAVGASLGATLILVVVLVVANVEWGLGSIVVGAFPDAVLTPSTLDLDRSPTVQLSLLALQYAMIVIVAVVVTLRSAYRPSPLIVGIVVAGSVTAIALALRWEMLIRVRYDFLLPDAQGYLEIGRSFLAKMERYESGNREIPILKAMYQQGFDGHANYLSVFYAGGHNGREPLWSAILDAVCRVIGFSAFHARLTSLWLSAGIAGGAALLGWTRVHPIAGVVGGLLVATNAPHIANGVHGLREEVVTVLLLLLIGVTTWIGRRQVTMATFRAWVTEVQVSRWPLGGVTVAPWRVIAIGCTASAVILVRADMTVLVAILLGSLGFAYRWQLRSLVHIGALIGVLAGPMYLGYAITHGDPMWPGTYGATVNRNLEFPERMGSPGFPSPEEYAANWAAGPLISPTTYFFGYHTPQQFVEYSGTGFIRIFREILFADQSTLLWCFWIGLALACLSGNWIIPWGIVIGLFPFYAFMAGVPNPWVFPGRYAHQVLPFATLAVSCVVVVPMAWIRSWRSGHASDPLV